MVTGNKGNRTTRRGRGRAPQTIRLDVETANLLRRLAQQQGQTEAEVVTALIQAAAKE